MIKKENKKLINDSNYTNILNNLSKNKNKKRNYLDYLSDMNHDENKEKSFNINSNKFEDKIEKEYINPNINDNILSLKDKIESVKNLCYNPFRKKKLLFLNKK